jgi:hypothetical protein
MVINRKSPQSGHHLIVHNIGAGPKMEDVLFNWRITATTGIRSRESGPCATSDITSAQNGCMKFQSLGCEVLNFDQATNHLPSSESNWSI